MSKELAVIVLGLSVIVVTQLGIPGSWRTTILVLIGAALAGVGFFLRAESRSRLSHSGDLKGTSNHTFVENGAPRALKLEHDRKEGIGPLN